MASASDWLHFHQSNNSVPGQVATPYSATSPSDLFFSGRASESTVVSTTNMSPIADPTPSGLAQLGPNTSRVTKPARKRTRASRRTPTTLLNTDTTNFRAMVQQFTGGPSSNFEIPGPGPQVYGNGLGRGFGLQLPVGQLQQQVLGSLQYSMSTNNNSNNNSNMMFMQRMGDNNFTPTDHHHGSNNDHSNINVNMRLSGTRGGSPSSENRSIDSFQF